jgi:hypothetical protein
VLTLTVLRARDPPAEEEKEILSSTSKYVREIWDGHRVIRQCGESKTAELVFGPDIIRLPNAIGVYYEVTKGALCRKNLKPIGLCDECLTKEVDNSSLQKILGGIAPNLTLNVPDAIPKPRKVRLFVILGLSIQITVLVINALAVYCTSGNG